MTVIDLISFYKSICFCDWALFTCPAVQEKFCQYWFIWPHLWDVLFLGNLGSHQGFYMYIGVLVQSLCGKINVIMTLGGGGLGLWRFITALSADFSFCYDYALLWLNKSRHASSNVKICINFSDSYVKHYVAKSACVHVATGKQLQETVKEAQVCNESMKI